MLSQFSPANISAPSRRGGPALGVVLVIGLALRTFGLGTASLWNDELFTRFYPELGLSYMWTTGFTLETTPPTYYTFMAGWIHLFGTSPEALRWPSVIFSTIAITLTYILGLELGGRLCGLIAALIFALSPMEIYFAQEARAYALLLLPVGLALLGTAWFLREATTNRGAICYAAGMVSAIYVHNVSAFLAAACAITVALDLITDRQVSAVERHTTLIRWIVVNFIVAFLSVPELLAMLAELRTEQLFWMAPTSLWDIRYSVATFVAGPATSPLAIATAMTLLLAGATSMALVRLRIDRRATMVLIVIPALDFAFILAAGLRQALLVPRLLCWMWIPLAVVLAFCLLRSVGMRWSLAAVIGAVFATGLGFQLRQDATAKEPWGLLFPRVAPLMERADLIVTGPWTQPMALAYRGVDLTKVRHWDENFPVTIESGTIRDLLGVRPIGRTELSSAIRSGRHVLLLQRSVEFRYRALLTDLPEPREQIIQECWSDGECLAAFYWGNPP